MLINPLNGRVPPDKVSYVLTLPAIPANDDKRRHFIATAQTFLPGIIEKGMILPHFYGPNAQYESSRFDSFQSDWLRLFLLVAETNDMLFAELESPSACSRK